MNTPNLDALFTWLNKTRRLNKIVMAAAQELAALKARIAELEALAAELNERILDDMQESAREER